MYPQAINQETLFSIFQILWYIACFVTSLSLTLYFVLNYHRNVIVVAKTNEAYYKAQREYHEKHAKHKNSEKYTYPSSSERDISKDSLNITNKKSTCGSCGSSINISKSKVKNHGDHNAGGKVNVVALKQSKDHDHSHHESISLQQQINDNSNEYPGESAQHDATRMQHEKKKKKQKKQIKSHKKMAFYTIQYSKNQIKLLKNSLICLITNVIGILLITIVACINFSSNVTIRIWIIVGGVLILCSRYYFKWILIDMLIFVLGSSAYRCSKKTIAFLRFLIICVCISSIFTVGGMIIILRKPNNELKGIGIIVVISFVSVNILITFVFHFAIWWIYVKKSYGVANDLSITDTTVNVKNKAKLQQAKKVLLDRCVIFVVITGFLAFVELIFVALLLLGFAILGPMNITFVGAINCLVIVLLAPFSTRLYALCCTIIDKCCKNCFHDF